MYYRNQLYKSSLYQKFQKVCKQLQQLLQAGTQESSEKIKSLTKRRERYLKQLISVPFDPVKTGSALAFAMLLASQTNAQQCTQYADAGAANALAKVITVNDVNPVFVDIDNDGDLDCYTAGRYTYLSFFKNIGTKEIPVYSPSKASGFSGAVHIGQSLQFADMDGDGDYDCFITDGSGTYRVYYYENTGTNTNPVFVENEAKNPLSFIRGSYSLSLTIADIDSDGDYDVFTSDNYYSKLFQNIGTKTAARFVQIDSGLLGFDHRIYYDWNKDGLLDYLEEGGAYYFRNIGPTPADLNYVYDPKGPDFSVFGRNNHLLYSLADITGDGAPEAFTYYCKLATITPVPVITDSSSASQTKLIASPKNKNYKYQWQRNGKDIPGATRNIVVTSTAGIYTVEITNTCGTGVSLPYKLSTTAATFAEAEASTIQFTKTLNSIEQPSLKAYPNPFIQQFSLNLGDSYLPNTLVKITDVQGRIASIVKANNSVMQLGSNLQKGVYIVQVVKENMVVFTQKIIKE